MAHMKKICVGGRERIKTWGTVGQDPHCRDQWISLVNVVAAFFSTTHIPYLLQTWVDVCMSELSHRLPKAASSLMPRANILPTANHTVQLLGTMPCATDRHTSRINLMKGQPRNLMVPCSSATAHTSYGSFQQRQASHACRCRTACAETRFLESNNL